MSKEYVNLDDSHLWDSFINMYVKCGSFFYARKLFDVMPRRDVVAWTALIAGSVREMGGKDGLFLFSDMRRESVCPNGFVLSAVLKACAACLDRRFTSQVHAEVIKLGFLCDLFVGSGLVDAYSKCGEVGLAKRVFFDMPDHNSVSLNALLNGYASSGDEREVLELFRVITESEVRLSKFTLSTVLKCCGSLGAMKEGRVVHGLAIKIGLELDMVLSSCLVDMYSKCGDSDSANGVFERIRRPDVVLWTSMISCFDRGRRFWEACKLFMNMCSMGIMPNEFTLATVVSSASELGDLVFGKSVHGYILKQGFEKDNSVANSLIMMYMSFGAVEDGCKAFDALDDQDTISWNALLSGFHNGEGNSKDGRKIFVKMLDRGFKPNKYTFISVLRSCTSLGAVDFGSQIHTHIVKNDIQRDEFVTTALIDMYAKCNSLQSAVLIFEKLNLRDVFAWTVIISGYTQTDKGEDALKCFRRMHHEGIKPNEFTFASCLSACSSISSLETGRQIHSRAIKAGLSHDAFVESALVDMYTKCGCLEDAEVVFGISAWSRDLVLWNTMICGYSHHGYGEKSLATFQNLIDKGVKPDEVTFVGVLSACSHAGLIDDGWRHFNSLRDVYGITPTIVHHACMVDLLGRVGDLNHMEQFLTEMNVVPDALIWQTVLGACRVHGNIKLAERAADKLLELDPHMDSAYILLSNIYALKGRWHDVARVRRSMTHQGVKKEPGCSWIEVDGDVHVFVSKDGSHPRAHDIYHKLEELREKLDLAGYVPNAGHALLDVSDDEKRESLLYHSERLALAYGLICSKPNKPIRVFKNLRTCGDCHEAIKLISKIEEREFIVRDVSRFHHFRNGSCSCQDYW
ncbi:Pentatricopeptide repeat-containing protein [Acorus gramineus]|uniref:Pentatricopeptide repeat-containing protein n=1 Tax=Acorus gramineus TaxID=55184 RepID=A0AAV9AT21_ACOGR|nr:Pentatricopeptide repeat-containing protein [Acorus gramineus]